MSPSISMLSKYRDLTVSFRTSMSICLIINNNPVNRHLLIRCMIDFFRFIFIRLPSMQKVQQPFIAQDPKMCEMLHVAVALVKLMWIHLSFVRVQFTLFYALWSCNLVARIRLLTIKNCRNCVLIRAVQCNLPLANGIWCVNRGYCVRCLCWSCAPFFVHAPFWDTDKKWEHCSSFNTSNDLYRQFVGELNMML